MNLPLDMDLKGTETKLLANMSTDEYVTSALGEELFNTDELTVCEGNLMIPGFR